jgi:predicted component of type VI protein secretion system
MNKAVTLFVLLCLGTIILFSCATANRFDPAAPLVSIERAEPKNFRNMASAMRQIHSWNLGADQGEVERIHNHQGEFEPAV